MPQNTNLAGNYKEGGRRPTDHSPISHYKNSNVNTDLTNHQIQTKISQVAQAVREGYRKIAEVIDDSSTSKGTAQYVLEDIINALDDCNIDAHHDGPPNPLVITRQADGGGARHLL